MTEKNTSYIDAFVFPIAKAHLTEYRGLAESVGKIWKEYGALSYSEYVGDDLEVNGLLSFPKVMEAKEGEVLIFGWATFESKEARDEANKKVPMDSRMRDLVAPLMNPDNLIFNAKRMAYGGFKKLVEA